MKSKKILITGGHGFLGGHLVELLRKKGYSKLITPSSRECDLTDAARTRAFFGKTKPQAVVHLAARVGGIGANQLNPGLFFYQNIVMGTQLMEISRLAGVEKFLATGTVCSYPKFTPVPFREDRIWEGYPEETNAPYGLAKKMLLVQSQAYRTQYKFNGIFLIPVNMYGPRDNFDPGSSHVIPALIRKFIESRQSGKKHITVWGDGTASREFLYVEDCAEAIHLALEKYDKGLPVNIGTGREIKIKALAEMIRKMTGFKGDIFWDRTKPNGQPRRCLDVSRAKKEFGFTAKTSFEEGLRKTIDWYESTFKK